MLDAVIRDIDRHMRMYGSSARLINEKDTIAAPPSPLKLKLKTERVDDKRFHKAEQEEILI